MDTPTMRQQIVEFVQAREVAAAREAVKALHDCVALKRATHLPLLAETHRAVEQLEDEIHSLKLALLRQNHPDQMPLPGMEDLSKEGKQEASHRGDMASRSCPVEPHPPLSDPPCASETAYSPRSIRLCPEGISWLCAAFRGQEWIKPAMRWNRLHGERWIKPCRQVHPKCTTQTWFWHIIGDPSGDCATLPLGLTHESVSTTRQHVR